MFGSYVASQIFNCLKAGTARFVSALIPVRAARHEARDRLMRAWRIREPNYGLLGNGWADYLGGDFKQYILENNIPEMIHKLKKDLDEPSRVNVDAILSRILLLPNSRMRKYCMVDGKKIFSLCATTEEKEFDASRKTAYEQFRSDYACLGGHDLFSFSVFHCHHGLASANESIRRYICGKDFLDCGAQMGDSALVFQKKYSPRKVYSFEIDGGCCRLFPRLMELNSVSPDKYEVVKKALHNKCGTVSFYGDIVEPMNEGGASGPDGSIEAVTIDSFAGERDLWVGFIKADIEGSEIRCLEGMVATLKRDRPVVSFCIYHNPEQFFGLKPLLESMVEDYVYEIKMQTPEIFDCNEFILFAYPKELKYDF